jgi:cytochrome c553
MKKYILILVSVFVIGTFSVFLSSCATTASIAEKSGTQLWSENCVRCHNTTPSTAFSNTNWEIASMHMKIRANLTAEESKKVLEFLKSAN